MSSKKGQSDECPKCGRSPFEANHPKGARCLYDDCQYHEKPTGKCEDCRFGPADKCPMNPPGKTVSCIKFEPKKEGE